MCKLLKKIEQIADPEKDRLMLLLCNLVDDRFTDLSRRLDTVDEKIKEVSEFITQHSTCPVVGNEEQAKILLFLVRYPKITFAVVIGLAGLAGISFGINLGNIIPLLK